MIAAAPKACGKAEDLPPLLVSPASATVPSPGAVARPYPDIMLFEWPLGSFVDVTA